MVANAAARGGGGENRQVNRGGYHSNCSGGGSSNSNHNNGGEGCPGNPNNPYKDHQCQVCRKLGHTALRCWKRFNKNYNGPDKVVNAVSTSYNLDPVWYVDSAATDHITSDLDKLTMRENYGDNDQVHAANGSGMTIKHVGHSAVSTPHHRILLNNVLHVPQANRNLAYVQCLTADNDVFLKLYPTFFLVKDRSMRRTLLHRSCKIGLYPIPSLDSTPHKQCLNVTKPSTKQWHSRLGHPSFKTVSRVLRDHELPSVSNKNVTHVCDACQQGKSHQLLFPKSVSVSKAPLELIFSDVWGPVLLLLASIIIMCLSSMILVSSPEFICCNISLRCSKNSMIFKLMLRDFLIVRC
jgi:hypothetical protein